ncbi:coat protein [Passion fruit mosaic virus]|uniref:Capsid protein n=1 Tax=Passion fruit mosaic virus TaxID=1032457 RepID=F6KJM7_9VIRU|nr:unnamed protein product [Passion fruit mosaic virus]AEF01561.1 coat protein [Passion fruit mosaic virus]
MPYQPVSLQTLPWLSANWADYKTLLSVLRATSATSFQTQAGRDSIRSQLAGCVSELVQVNVRFPERYLVYVNDPSISDVWGALLKATDTKNRIIEVDNERNPSNNEIESVTRRVDDASVAIRINVERLLKLLGEVHGVYDRALFEQVSGLRWADDSAPASTSK